MICGRVIYSLGWLRFIREELLSLGMLYTILLHPKVEKFLKSCDQRLSERVRSKLKMLADDPFRFLEHVVGQDFFKLRIGDYRALVDVDQSRKIVFVRVLDHRSTVYKRM